MAVCARRVSAYWTMDVVKRFTAGRAAVRHPLWVGGNGRRSAARQAAAIDATFAQGSAQRFALLSRAGDCRTHVRWRTPFVQLARQQSCRADTRGERRTRSPSPESRVSVGRGGAVRGG